MAQAVDIVFPALDLPPWALTFTIEPAAALVSRGRAAADRALAIDSTMAEAHAALGQIALYFDRDFPAAEAAYRRALGLNPNYATAHQWMGELLILRGRYDESMVYLEQAAELDPLSPIILHVQALHAYYARDFPRAVRTYEALMKLLGRAAAEPELRPAAVSALALAADGVAPGEAALLYALMEERELAVEYLERGYAAGEYLTLFVTDMSAFDLYRHDPRVQTLRHRMGLPESPR